MSGQYRENWKRLANRLPSSNASRDNPDMVRFQDESILTTNASGIGGVPYTGTPSAGELIRFNGVSFAPSPDTSGPPVVTSVSGTYSAAVLDEVIIGDASGVAFTITLPPASAGILSLTIKKIDSSLNAITVAGSGSQTIDGESSLDITAQYESVTVISDATQWWIL
jgi:hypothetical protein